MNSLRLPTSARLAIFALLLSPVFAQNSITNANNATTNPDQCPLHIHGDFNPNAPINSTGSVDIHWNALMMDPARNDWVFTLTYNETRNQQAPGVGSDARHYLQAYISAPEASEARVCVHMFGGLNASSTSSQRNGCDGVLDDGCLNFLGNAMFSSDCSLPSSRTAWTEELRQACGSDVATEFTSTTTARDLTNKSCTIDHPPGSTAPDGYRTWAAIGRASLDAQVDTNPSSFTRYDTYIRQTVGFLVSADFGSVKEAQVVCVAPRDVVEGGRVPAQLSRACPRWASGGWVGIAGSVMVGAVSALL